MATDDKGASSHGDLTGLDSKIPIAVADAKGVPVDELDETLYDTLDPNALVSLAESSGIRRIVFDFCGYVVTIQNDMTIELEESTE